MAPTPHAEERELPSLSPEQYRQAVERFAQRLSPELAGGLPEAELAELYQSEVPPRVAARRLVSTPQPHHDAPHVL